METIHRESCDNEVLVTLPNPRCHLHLGDDVYVTAKTWNGKLEIHVRKYEVYPSGKTYPTKRGIVLTLKHWLEVSSVHMQLKQQGRYSHVHVGGNMYASWDDNGIDVRQWENDQKSGRVIPTNQCILLSLDQWEKLVDCVRVMSDFVPELKDRVPCMLQDDHQNQMGYLQCSFCNPSDYSYWV
ncbi:uncharacterized protein LOC124252755 [Haliotis rubra]|uniref:uncharacterized protein LOC124252755 n=1 Tax=Haliotis rubra TaxID=36100 RepID=UPI001EE6055E|nr:uncharacterized protein LOC124252755 [Haliotis rubra]